MSDPSGSEETREPGMVADPAPREPRPIVERIGLAAIAGVLAVLFGGVAAASSGSYDTGHC